MENAHAHPSSPTNTLHSRSRSVSTHTNRDSPHNQPTTTPRSAPNTRQQRLLHTRHARFSAQRLSVSGIAFPTLMRSSENDSSHFAPPRFLKQDENATPSDKSSELTGSSPTSTILNEIATFAASRKRSPHTRPPIPIFKDSTDQSDTPTFFRDSSVEASAFSTESIEDSTADMGLKELSVNLHRPSPKNGSPYYASPRSSTRRRSSQQRSRFNSEEYIQHIENELEMVKDAMYSPNTHVPWKEKLKKAKQENDQLKKELESLQTTFEFELRDAVERSTEIELRLKRKIRDLEEDVEQKDATIQELEYHHEETRLDQSTMDALKTRIDKLEEERSTLELTNRGMTKRNEVLTQLLALSPTKTQHAIELPTPRRRNARPMSLIIPRVPSSPVERVSLKRPQSVVISPGQVPSDYFSRYTLSSPVASSPLGAGHARNITNEDGQSVDSGLGESCSHFTTGTHSRRSTLASQVSSSPELLPVAHTHCIERPSMPAKQPSKRRPRKFMPGSTQLKPLLLPTFTAENGNLPSASALTSPDRPVSAFLHYTQSHLNRPEHMREQPKSPMDSPNTSSQSAQREYLVSEPGPSFQSLDEVFSKMGESFERTETNEAHSSSERQAEGDQEQVLAASKIAEFEASVATVDHQSVPRPRVRSWVLKTTPTPPNGPNAIHDHGHPSVERRTSYDSLEEPNSSPPCISDSVLDMSSVEVPRPLFSKKSSQPVNEEYLDSRSHLDRTPLNPRKRRKADSKSEFQVSTEDNNNGDFDNGLLTTTPRARLTPRSVVKRQVDITKERRRSGLMSRNAKPRVRNPLEMLHQRNIGSKPLAAITIQTVYATLSRYTNYIQTFKQDPLALARRVIANAWRSNWAMFGKMSWWVLGLFISRRRPVSNDTAWDWDLYDGESIAHRYCAGQDITVRHKDGSPVARTRAPNLSNSPTDQRLEDSASSRSKVRHGTNNTRTGWGNSLFLWGKFSVAIMLAVGGAIVRGPAEMMRETEDHSPSQSNGLDQDCRTSSSSSARPPPEDEAPSECFKLARIRHHSRTSGYTELPNSGRKVRSFSSPSPGSQKADTLCEPPADQIRPPARPLMNQMTPSHNLLVDEPESHVLSNDETLKPKRSERKGLESVFMSPGDALSIHTVHTPTRVPMDEQGTHNTNANSLSDYG